MGLDANRLAGVIAPDLESKIRADLIGGSMTAYPNLTKYCQDIAASIAAAVINEIKTNGVVTISSGVVAPGTFVVGTTAVTGSGSLTSGTGTIS